MQVDENMRRAQQRDAVNQAKFYFRREIFTPTSSRATSGAATPDIPGASVASSTNGITNGFHSNHNGRPKQRMMENCFPPLPLPDEGLVGGSVKEEYGEYTMDEIINGRVNKFFTLRTLQPSYMFGILCFLFFGIHHHPSPLLHAYFAFLGRATHSRG